MIQYLIFIFISLSTSYGLRWNPSGFTTNRLTTISLKSSTDVPEIDVYIGEQITIIKNLRSSLSITIFCFISGYNAQSAIRFSFCKNNMCDIMVKDGESETIHHKYNMKYIETISNFPGKKGLRIKVNLAPSSPEPITDNSGDYHCEAHDVSRNFMIRSSNIQIRDKVYWEEHLVRTIPPSQTLVNFDILQENLPVAFKCNEFLPLNPGRPAWINQEFVSPVYWSVCPVKNNYQSLIASEKMTLQTCVTFTLSKWERADPTLSPIDISKKNDWTYVVNEKGELIIFHLKPDLSFMQLTYSLLCYTKKFDRANRINIFYKEAFSDDIKTGILFNSTRITYKRPLRPVSPEIQNVRLYSRTKVKIDRDVPVVSIYCLYNASSEATAKWYYNGAVLTQMKEYISFDKYKVNFEGDITSAITGLYTLQVTDGMDSITMKIFVTVLGSPSLVDPNCLPMIKHIWEYESAVFNCTFKDDPKELTIYINKQEIPIRNSLFESRNDLQKTYPYLSLLNFSILQSPPGNVVNMIYSVYNLTKTLGQTIYQDHTVMFQVKNEFGLSVKSASVYTIPRPQSLFGNGMPHEFNCATACGSLETHTFKCNIDLRPYENKDLIVDHFWTIHGHRLEQINAPGNIFAPYFRVNPDTKELTLSPVKSNDSMRDEDVKGYLKNSNIICHLNLLSALDSPNRFKYYSIMDETVKQSLQARITLDYQDINHVYIYWVVISGVISGVVSALIIILIMIVFHTSYFNRKKGETHQLNKF